MKKSTKQKKIKQGAKDFSKRFLPVMKELADEEVKLIKAWAVIDKSEKIPSIFYSVLGNFHIFNTKKNANEYIDRQFFDCKNWRVIPVLITPLNLKDR